MTYAEACVEYERRRLEAARDGYRTGVALCRDESVPGWIVTDDRTQHRVRVRVQPGNAWRTPRGGHACSEQVTDEKEKA